MDLRTYLRVKLREIISEWKEDDIYAISFSKIALLSNVNVLFNPSFQLSKACFRKD